jgi:hypothetical protein
MILTKNPFAITARSERRKKGTFSEGFFVDSVTLHEDSPWIEYFEADPARYPEIKD